jgi:c-di-GMP-binding flagellar brake protein YcgR
LVRIVIFAANFYRGDVEMSEITTIRGEQPRKVIQTVIQQAIPAILTYLSKGKWHAAKIQLIRQDGNRLSVKSAAAMRNQHPINIQINQPVGVSFKHEFGKYVFESTVLGFEQSASAKTDGDGCGAIVLGVPEQMEIIERRSYFRVEVPSSLKVRVLLWPRIPSYKINDDIFETKGEKEIKCCIGRLIDISAGGIAITVPYQQPEEFSATNPKLPAADKTYKNNIVKSTFKKGQFIGIRFTAMPYETPITLSAQIRNILSTADGQGVSIGMQIVGLEASAEGHQLLTRLVTIVSRYYQLNLSDEKQKDKGTLACAV